MIYSICCAVFALVVAVLGYYYGQVLIWEMWNSKGSRKAREDAIQAIKGLLLLEQDGERKDND